MVQRLQKIISARGIASRRRAEEMIQAGLVSVNGRVASLGDSADPELDDILVEGKPLPSAAEYIYIMLHKPRGYVTTLSDEKGRDNVSQLVEDCGVRVYPIGRLDMDSEGLLLLTNDGDFANSLMHPKHEVEKTYRVSVSGYYEGADQLLRRPIVLDGYRIRPPKVKLLDSRGDKASLTVTIHEGRNRQIRRMCEAAGMNVVRLVRLQEGSVSLGNLPKGKWRFLTDSEIMELKK